MNLMEYGSKSGHLLHAGFIETLTTNVFTSSLCADHSR